MAKVMKAKYAAPTVKKIGGFGKATQHSHKGTVLDATFNAGTPDSQLTHFS